PPLSNSGANRRDVAAFAKFARRLPHPLRNSDASAFYDAQRALESGGLAAALHISAAPSASS
ncbi:MAG TPA: hypothetical protein VF883_01000, partial [Thermoanaerobaculia bacterium]